MEQIARERLERVSRMYRSNKEVEGIEPEDESPVNTAYMGKKRGNSLQFKGLQGSAEVRNKQKAEEAAHLSGIDPNAIYAICMQQPELIQVAVDWARLSAEERAYILEIID